MQRNFRGAAIIGGSVPHQRFITKPLLSMASLTNAARPRARISSVFQRPHSPEPSNTVLFSRRALSQQCPLMAQPNQPLQGLCRYKPNKRWPGLPRLFMLLVFSLVFSIFQGGPRNWQPGTDFMTIHHDNIAVGKYLVSPLAKPQDAGGYAASVSIRSGRGSATHDRVLRFSGLFDSAASALQYATEHALSWIQERSSPTCA